jgi:hypothetical protein
VGEGREWVNAVIVLILSGYGLRLAGGPPPPASSPLQCARAGGAKPCRILQNYSRK